MATDVMMRLRGAAFFLTRYSRHVSTLPNIAAARKQFTMFLSTPLVKAAYELG
jgi:hypothetical protein